MRVYPHWTVRFGGLLVALPFGAGSAQILVLSNFDPLRVALVALFLTLIIGMGLRALIGGVEATQTEYVVRNVLRTRRIPRHHVTAFPDYGGLWSIEWTSQDGTPRRMLLSWFSSRASFAAVRRHDAQAIETLRAWQQASEPPVS